MKNDKTRAPVLKDYPLEDFTYANINEIIIEKEEHTAFATMKKKIDISLLQNNSIVAKQYADPLIKGESKIVIYGNGSDSIMLPKNAEYLFSNKNNPNKRFSKLEKITGLEVLNSTFAENYNYIFCGCSCIKELNLNNWNTYYLHSAEGMFSGCRSLENLKISNFDTTSLTNAAYMFFECESLAKLDISQWNTPNLDNTDFMFASCRKLETLKMNLTTDHVYSFLCMFQNCQSLKFINGVSFSTTAANSTRLMFSGCISLAEVPGLEKWDMENIEDLSGMFEGCKAIHYLYLDDWKLTKAEKTVSMFEGCCELKSIGNIKNWEPSNLLNAQRMFLGCDKLVNLNLSNWKPSALENTEQMFAYCSSLKRISLFNDGTDSLSNLTETFAYCESLASLDLSNWITESSKNVTRMLYNCYSLTELNLNGCDLGLADGIDSMFYGCNKLFFGRFGAKNTENITITI